MVVMEAAGIGEVGFAESVVGRTADLAEPAVVQHVAATAAGSCYFQSLDPVVHSHFAHIPYLQVEGTVLELDTR